MSEDEDPAYRVESHACAWEYVPIIGDMNEEHPLWRCAKRWSDGTRCQARSASPDLMTEARWAFPVTQPQGRVESHVCHWQYAPLVVDGQVEPEWRCVKRWSDGTRCRATLEKLPEGPVLTEYARP